jgi:hypothetical protein
MIAAAAAIVVAAAVAVPLLQQLQRSMHTLTVTTGITW